MIMALSLKQDPFLKTLAQERADTSEKPKAKAGNVTIVTSKKPAFPDPILSRYNEEGILGTKPGMVKLGKKEMSVEDAAAKMKSEAAEKAASELDAQKLNEALKTQEEKEKNEMKDVRPMVVHMKSHVQGHKNTKKRRCDDIAHMAGLISSLTIIDQWKPGAISLYENLFDKMPNAFWSWTGWIVSYVVLYLTIDLLFMKLLRARTMPKLDSELKLLDYINKEPNAAYTDKDIMNVKNDKEFYEWLTKIVAGRNHVREIYLKIGNARK